MSKYAPLHDHLSSVRSNELPMTLAEVEGVLGFPLPASAHSYPAWWSNNHHNPAVKAWRAAGWITSRVDLARKRLVFVREAPDRGPSEPATPRQGVIRLDPTALNPAARAYFQKQVQATGGGMAEVVARFINEEITTPRKRLLDHFAARSPRLRDDSTPLIREDRDGR